MKCTRLVYAGCVFGMVVLVRLVFAEEPNFVQTATYLNPTGDARVVSTSYSDGIGRALQTRLDLSLTKGLFNLTEYRETFRS